MTLRALYNGLRKVPDLSQSRALQYGDGVFRTCLIHDGLVVDLDRQIRKLGSDARALGLMPPPATRLRHEAGILSAPHPQAVLKMILFRSGPGRGYAPHSTRAERLLQVSAVPAYPARCWTRGIRTERSPVTLGSQPRLAGLKHLNRLEQVLAAGEMSRGVDEVLMADDGDHPVCGSRSNLFWVRRHRLHTPSLERCGVAGLMREKILGLARRRGIPAVVSIASWNQIEDADEIFVCNSLVGIWPVRQFGARRWNTPGLVTAVLGGALKHPRLEQP